MQVPDEPIMDCVPLEQGAERRIRDHFGLDEGRRLKIAFLGGPGDVVGTFDYWMKGHTDPRIPVIGYSSQFYTLVEKIGADALVLTEPAGSPETEHPRFRFVHTPRHRPAGRIAYRVDRARFARAVLREIAAFDPDVMVVGSETPLSVIRGVPRRGRVVLSAHSTFWPMGRRGTSLRARLQQARIARALKRISAAVCTSPECCAQISQLSGNGVQGFVETPQIPLAYAQPAVPRTEARKLLYLGRIERDKGVLDLVAAFDRVAATLPGVSLEIAGDGAAEAELRAMIDVAEHGAQIDFVGRLSGESVHAALERADLLICPTRAELTEGLALVVVEAAAHGVPTLLSSVVPAKEVVAGACLEFPAGDIDALQAKLHSVVSDRAGYQDLVQGLSDRRAQFFDRSLSWGMQLYRALLV